jgi:hypothetical protein
MEITIKTTETVERELTITLPYYFQIGELNIFCMQKSENECVRVMLPHSGFDTSIHFQEGTYWLMDKQRHPITKEEFESKYNEAMNVLKGAML